MAGSQLGLTFSGWLLPPNRLDARTTVTVAHAHDPPQSIATRPRSPNEDPRSSIAPIALQHAVDQPRGSGDGDDTPPTRRRVACVVPVLRVGRRAPARGGRCERVGVSRMSLAKERPAEGPASWSAGRRVRSDVRWIADARAVRSTPRCACPNDGCATRTELRTRRSPQLRIVRDSCQRRWAGTPAVKRGSTVAAHRSKENRSGWWVSGSAPHRRGPRPDRGRRDVLDLRQSVSRGWSTSRCIAVPVHGPHRPLVACPNAAKR